MLSALLLLAAAAPSEVALLCTGGDGSHTELRFERPGEALGRVAARFEHLPGSTVYGALLPGGRTVLAIAQTSRARDPSFAAALVRLEPGRPPVTLADRVALSTRPLVTSDGRVFVQRGLGGEHTLDEVDPRTGAARTLHRFEGYTAFIAGAYRGEVLLYRVAAAGADLVAVHRDTLFVRALVPRLAPMARDFTADGRALYFTTADGEGWRVDRVDLESGRLETAARGAHVALLPTVLPTGLAWSKGPGLGSGPLAARGPGFERVQRVRGGWVYALHEVPGGFPRAYATELLSGRSLELASPLGTRLDLAGVLE